MTGDTDRPEALRLLRQLDRALASSATEVEFYFVGGAVIYQAFSAQPGTARVTALFRPAEEVRAAVRKIGDAEELPAGWLHKTVRVALDDGTRPSAYVELPRVRAFVAPPEYVLAVKCAAMWLGEAFGELDDVRYVLRAMNIDSAADALSVIHRYFTKRQLPPDTDGRLEELIAP